MAWKPDKKKEEEEEKTASQWCHKQWSLRLQISVNNKKFGLAYF